MARYYFPTELMLASPNAHGPNVLLGGNELLLAWIIVQLSSDTSLQIKTSVNAILAYTPGQFVLF